MTVRTYITSSLIATVSSWAIWLLIIYFLDPRRAGWLGFSLFFLTLFIAVASTAGLFGYGLRRLISPKQIPTYTVRTSLRQGVLLALLLVLLLILQLTRLFYWWLTIIAVALFLITEFVFISYDRAANRVSTSNKE